MKKIKYKEKLHLVLVQCIELIRWQIMIMDYYCVERGIVFICMNKLNNLSGLED